MPTLPQDALYVLTGPTAVGKTELALLWAEANEAEIVSADSLLFYRGMNIGTAKPASAELARVRHHLVDITAPSAPLSIADYVGLAQKAVDDILSRGKRVLVTGGSGFYLKSFFEPVIDDTPLDPAVREAVRAIEANGGLPALLDALVQRCPDGIEELDTNNPVRVARALERCITSGKTLRQLQAEFAAQPKPFPANPKKAVLLQRDENALWQRVCRRVDAMLHAGLLDEVAALLEKGLERNRAAANSIGYRESIAYLRTGSPKPPTEQLAAEIAVNTRKLVAKQRKWFRHQIRFDTVIQLDDSSSPGELVQSLFKPN